MWGTSHPGVSQPAHSCAVLFSSPCTQNGETHVATFLYRLGRFSYRRRKIVGAIWLALVVLFGVGASALSGPTQDSFEIPGTESQEAFNLLEERFPAANAEATSARVVFAALRARPWPIRAITPRSATSWPNCPPLHKWPRSRTRSRPARSLTTGPSP